MRKKARQIEGAGLSATLVPARDAPEDRIEADELCVAFSAGLWLWLVYRKAKLYEVSRQVKPVLGLVFGDRSDESLKEAWGDVPAGGRGRAVSTDRLAAYARFFPVFPEGQPTPCDKGSGLTSIVAALNTKTPGGGNAHRGWCGRVAAWGRASPTTCTSGS